MSLSHFATRLEQLINVGYHITMEKSSIIICEWLFLMRFVFNSEFDLPIEQHKVGIERGVEKGIKEGIEKTAKRMKKEGFTNEQIKKITGLPNDEIKKL